MPTLSRRGPWFTLVCVLLFGLFLIRYGSADPGGGPPQPRPAAAVHRHTPAAALLPAAPDPLPRAAPLRLTIPSAGVKAPLTPVGLDAEGWIASPSAQDRNLAGWYAASVSPGERGTSVITGHVDTKAGPAVFQGLGSLERGAHVEVRRGDGRTAVFAVYAVELYTRKDFPAEKIYADAPEAELRLITCGGDFSKRTGYEGNVVAFARLIAIR
ncbi:class F sortase [Streptomyces sp. NPDC058572]|uniref:class F sortase n=1 Tax=Streptomyces sp. NPDC058572 TaxID=3346546 RepID=UPI0036463D7F